MSPPRRRCLARGCAEGRRTGQPFCLLHYYKLDGPSRAWLRVAGQSGNKLEGIKAVRAAIEELADMGGRLC